LLIGGSLPVCCGKRENRRPGSTFSEPAADELKILPQTRTCCSPLHHKAINPSLESVIFSLFAFLHWIWPERLAALNLARQESATTKSQNGTAATRFVTGYWHAESQLSNNQQLISAERLALNLQFH
jgi:hypothetical protein